MSYDVVFILSNAVSVAPVDSRICPRVELNASALPLNRINPAFAASDDENMSLIERFCSFAASSTIASTSARLAPSAINSLNDFPVFSRRILSVVLPVFPNSLSIAFMYVVVSAVATPFAVMIAYPVHNWSSATLLAFAVGMTLPIAEDNSATVVFPRFCV